MLGIELAKICSVRGCKVKHDAKGFCKKHYARWHRYGNPLYVPDPEEIKRKNSEGHRGKKATSETRKKMSVSMKKRKPNENSLEALRKANIARIGTKRKESTIKKMSKSMKKKYKNPDFKKRADIARQKMQSDPKVRKKIKINMKKIWGNPKYKQQQSKSHKGQISPMKGKQHTSKANEKNRIAHLGKKASLETIQKLIEFQNRPEVKQKSKEDRAKQKFPFKDSKPELLTQSILKEHKIKFKKHYNFKLSDSFHQADIVIEPNYVVEVFGDYWHFNPKKYDGESIQKVRRKEIRVKEVWNYDKYVIDGMKEQGYKVLVVWESELKDELEKTTKKILKFAKT